MKMKLFGTCVSVLCCLVMIMHDASATSLSVECSDTVDNDHDGGVDSLIELDPNNGMKFSVGGAGNPGVVKRAVVEAIRQKKFPMRAPAQTNASLTRAISREKRPHHDEGGSLDMNTLTQVCRVLGYKNYVSSTCRDGERSARYPNGKCAYHSPGDNAMYRFRDDDFVVGQAYNRTWIASITCKDALPACSDGWDNDGDGLADRADPGCASDNDNSEQIHDEKCTTSGGVTEFEQCRNTLDDDKDGLIDAADPGCWANPSDPNTYNPSFDDEGAGKTQCSDGVDNDGDGAIDYPADFSCQSAHDNDETNPKAQCQNGIDDDNDGLTDLADPGCSSAQDNSEIDGTTQCQDGKDNDHDGATDYPADFSCESKADNDEANPKSQCQNGIDDDGDNLIDMNDPGCSSAQDNSEADGTTQCQDGQDNDHDGATDYPADFSCESKTDNDEANPKSQCQNGIDDDGDNLIDMNDPGCSSAQDNNEADGTTQCQDGKDNDHDGATDYPADFSCESKSDNDEANPKSQCQNGIDDDGDTLLDMNDPGCSNPQDNNEGDGTAQCGDGKDNDHDGAIDYPADFSCESKADNDEANPKSQCQNGVDDDGDTLVDMDDPGCSSPQDNNEGDETAQCGDGKDNDSDGATDYPADFSCESKADNDEANPKAQCQNSTDDDGDSLVDLDDPGCSSSQDNDESDEKTQCNDEDDNDADGLVDMKDPGCESPQDNDESDEPSTLTVGLECVTLNVDGSKTAYLSYNNTTQASVTVTTDQSQGTLNEFVSSGATPVPPSVFKPGLSKGTVVVPFTGDSLTWLVRAPKSAASRATASAASLICAPVQPVAECRGYVNGVLKVRLGYSNPNTFDQELPVGVLNGFSPKPENRGQPFRFFAGLQKSVFEAPLASESEVATWSLNGVKVTLNSQLQVCDGECVDTATGAITGQLDQIASDLSDVMNRAANILGSAKVLNDDRVQIARNRRDAERARKKAAEYEALAKSLTIQFPAVIKTCPQAPQYCQSVDRGPTIDALRGLYANQRNSVKRTMARSYFRNTGATTRGDKLVRQAKDLEQQGLVELAKLPRIATECK